MNLSAIKKDLLIGMRECRDRGLYQSVKWLAELNYAIRDIKLDSSELPAETFDLSDEYDYYQLAKSYFDVREYDRCAFFLKTCTEPKSKFLYFYATFLSIEKKKLETMSESTCPPDPSQNESLKNLCALMKEDYQEKKLDGYSLYVYGLVLKKLDLAGTACNVFEEAVNAVPHLWAAWQELAILLPNRKKLCDLMPGDNWIKQFFLAYAHLEQLNNDEALSICENLLEYGFQKSFYLLAQIAIVHHNRRDLNLAIESFKELLKEDPYRLDNMDIYSNMLYVQEMKSDLAYLAHKAVSIDKYRVETCCIIGNYYSLRADHQKAVVYFQRALKLNPQYLSAWTLMGHEYMEMKNTNAAIQSYRHAIDINKRDYRAWYGLGQTYEILKMHNYSLYYYKQAHQLRPNDSRMMLAMGETYEKLEKTENAIKCYYQAFKIGDIEGTALPKLAKLYDNIAMFENAANAYAEYVNREEASGTTVFDEHSDYFTALKYLAHYHLRRANLDEAQSYAYKFLDNAVTKESAKALLKTIAAKRGEREEEEHDPILYGTSQNGEGDSCNVTTTDVVDMDESESDSYHSLFNKHKS